MDSYALQRRLTCILAADAVGYSKHMGLDEEGTIQVLAAHRAVIDGIIAFHRGRIVGTAGDSVLAEFTSAVEAVRCAVEIQDALRTRNDALPEHRRLLFRVGVNLGDVVVKDADLLGDGVNVAARLESLAEPGGICIASSVYDQITGKLDLGFQDIGEQNLKNITRPVRVYRVSGARPVEVAVGHAPAGGSPPAGGRPLLWGVAGAALALVAGATVLWSQGWIGARTGALQATQPPVAVVAVVAPTPASASVPTPAPATPTVASVPLPIEVRPSTKPAPKPVPAKPAGAQPVDTGVVTGGATSAPAAVASALPQMEKPSQTAPAATALSVFDGGWSVRVRCPKHEDALGYAVDLVATVENGLLRAETGSQGQPSWMLLRGRIESNGSARLRAQGLTGNPRFALKGLPEGSRYQYDVEARFVSNQGQGRRLSGRPCELYFDRL